ncbi:glutamate racemase [Robiginitomaculum antarcticum]|uniref:glutamate racemase n=1 Tax=Robiginitomaculum antarcticum TaxID=437507 RepID=UPI00036DF75F|nr:glutamate racemase [Robiginitomaculum antarcticum]
MGHRALIFDSGMGGLSVTDHIRRETPGLSLTYVADDMFRPYGSKSAAALRARLPGLLATLEIAVRPDIIVLACNTASVTALDVIRDAVRAPVVGVVPAVKPAAQESRTRTLAVLGTPGTVKRQYVDDLIANFAGDCRVLLQGSTALVALAENKMSGRKVDMDILRREVSPLFEGRFGADIDTVVLACTHFPLLMDELKSVTRQTINWVDSGQAIARRIKSLLLELPKDSREEPPDCALLIGPEAAPARRRIFAQYGFGKVVGLYP